MLLRVRSNVGTWKYQLDPSDTIATLSQTIGQEWKLLLPLSKDPTGQHPFSMKDSFSTLGIHHGDMIYCRVQAIGDGDQEDTGSTPTSNDQLVAKKPPVIDLVDSSSEDEKDGTSKTTRKRQRATATSPTEKKAPPTSKATSAKQKGSSTSSSAAMASTSLSSHPSKFQVASYNVWFGPPDPSAKQVYPQQRMDAIAKELDSCRDNTENGDLVFIGFQELTDSLVEYLTPHMKRMGYRFCLQPRHGQYGVGLAVGKEVAMVESKFLPYHNSCQGRGLLYIQTPTMIFATTHLESYMDPKTYNGVKQREEQIVEATTFCYNQLQAHPELQIAIVVGDFNWDDERPQSPNRPLLQVIPKGDWKDAGTPRDYTYDAKENPMLGGNLRRRFDRCIYLTQKNSKNNPGMETTTTTHLKKLGLTAIPNLTWNKRNSFNGTVRTVPVAPSDHFGLAITFETSGKDG